MAHPSDTDSGSPTKHPGDQAPSHSGKSPQVPPGETAALDSATSNDTTGQVPKRRKGVGGLSVSQTVGGALASMSAAALGSGLGVAGTVVGAALVSVCVAVLGSLYTASIKHTRWGVQKLMQTVGPVATARSDHSGQSVDTARSSDHASSSNGTKQRRHRDHGHDGSPPRTPTRQRRIVKGALAGAGAVFVITLGGILTVELISGHSFQGKPGGTTIGQAVRGKNLTHSDRHNGPDDSDRPGGKQSDRQQGRSGQQDGNRQPDRNNRDNQPDRKDRNGQPDRNNRDNQPDRKDRDQQDRNGQQDRNNHDQQQDRDGRDRPQQHNDRQPGPHNDKNPDSDSDR